MYINNFVVDLKEEGFEFLSKTISRGYLLFTRYLVLPEFALEGLLEKANKSIAISTNINTNSKA